VYNTNYELVCDAYDLHNMADMDNPNTGSIATLIRMSSRPKFFATMRRAHNRARYMTVVIANMTIRTMGASHPRFSGSTKLGFGQLNSTSGGGLTPPARVTRVSVLAKRLAA
jgi:hypothetical protein